MSSKTGFIPELAGLRGLAAFGVIFYHVDSFPFLFPFISGGWLGVALFLMLSMYLLLNNLDKNSDLKHYFKRRILRIWPIYYGCIIAAYLIYHFSAGTLAQYFTFTEYWITPGGDIGFLGVFWTLQLEEAMYLFIPLIHRSSHKLAIAYSLIVINLATYTLFSYLTYGITSAQVPFFFKPVYSYLESNYNLYFIAPLWVGAYGFGILAYYHRKKVPEILKWLVPVVFIGIGIGIHEEIYSLNLVFREIAYFAILPGFTAVLIYPPKFLKYLAILGEESYAIYATQFFFLEPLGIIGVPVTLLAGFVIELGLRPREMIRRLRIAYSRRTSTEPSKAAITITS